DPRRRRRRERGWRAAAGGTAGPRERSGADRAGAAAGDTGQSGARMRVVTFGELLLRLSPPGEERLLESPELHTCFGGAEANVAVALSHLGVRCDYVTRVPDNPLGDAGVEALRKEGVGTRWIARGGAGERLGLYFVEPGARRAGVLIGNPAAVSAMLGLPADDASLASPERARALAEQLAARFEAKRIALTRREILGRREHGWSAVLYDAGTRSFAQSRRHRVQVVDRVGG